MYESIRALVVDDEVISRKAVMFALIQEDFCCDYALDGVDALSKLEESSYDLVVTDLCMPNKHGHALAVELLQRTPCPVIVVHTVVDNPKITKDLIMRGVSDIVYKPTNYAAFAAKAKAMVRYRQDHPGVAEKGIDGASEGKTETDPEDPVLNAIPEGGIESSVTMADIESRIPLVSRILPVSKTAFEVYEMTRSNADAATLGSAIQHDAALAAEFLSIANSSFYNPSGKPMTDMEKAVVRIGQRRIGEMALAAATLSALTVRKLPWMDMQVVWRQSIAAGAAVEHLVAQGKHSKVSENLVLTGIMHSLGRVVLGTLYPAHYQELIKRCSDGDFSLTDQEATVFPETHAQIMSRLLTEWNVPAETSEPLQHVLTPYHLLSQLSNEMRIRVELVKVAIFVGQLSTNAWHSWDLVEIPPASVLERLGITDIGRVIERTQDDAKAIIDFKAENSGDKQTKKKPDLATDKPEPTAYYRNGSTSKYDFLQALIGGMDLSLTDMPSDGKLTLPTVFINCIGANRHTPIDPAFEADVEKVVITDGDLPPAFDSSLRTVRTPLTYGKMVKELSTTAK